MSNLMVTPPALPSRQDLRKVEIAWEAFVTGEERGLENVRPVIRESWHRCRRLRVDPYLSEMPLLSLAEEQEVLQERADLLCVAEPLFQTLLTVWEQERFLFILSDRSGRIVHLNGHEQALQRAQEINAVPGASMAEEQIGTGTANIVLTNGQPHYVLWSEHYCQVFHHWASLGAPIHHHATGEMIGVVLAAGAKLTHPRALDLIIRIAERIEQLVEHEELVRRSLLLDEYHRFVLQHPHDIVLALDGGGHVCGASAATTQLFAAPQEMLGKSVLRLPAIQVEGLRPIPAQEQLQPYPLRVTLSRHEHVLTATAVPVRGQRQAAGTLLILSRPSAPRSGKERALPARSLYTFADLVGHAPAFRACLDLARQAAAQELPILLLGESGTGKELLAQAIHTASPRCHHPFIAVNCGATSDELLSVELFGYVEGAFTGAAKGGRKGKLELAHGGTLFLDEVEAMSPKMQVSLLRVLEEGYVTRVGAERAIAVEVRVIAASNEDLRLAVHQKRFRADLYHRLAAFPISLPPLRERKEDLPALIQHLLQQLGYGHVRLSSEVVAVLRRYAWPGNVRELKNVLWRAAHLMQGATITLAEIPAVLIADATASAPASVGSLRETERALITRTLADVGGDIARAAAQLGIHRATLYRKLNRLGLARP